MRTKSKRFLVVMLAILLTTSFVITMIQPTQAGELVEDEDGNRAVYLTDGDIHVNVTFLETIPRDYEAPYSIYFEDSEPSSVEIEYTLYNESDVEKDSVSYEVTDITQGEWDNGTMDAIDIEDDDEGQYTANFTLSVDGGEEDTLDDVDVFISNMTYHVDETTRLITKLAPLLIIVAVILAIVGLLSGLVGGRIGGGW